MYQSSLYGFDTRFEIHVQKHKGGSKSGKLACHINDPVFSNLILIIDPYV